jgi:hypothetical protein
MLPWVVRDNDAVNKKLHPAAHPSTGLRREDNAPVSRLGKSLLVTASPSAPHLAGKRLGKGWWAAHCWMSLTDGGPNASTRPLTNSFVGNLVWLPSAVAKLTDIDGGLFQQEMQAISWSLYRRAPVAAPLRSTVEEIWGLLGEPAGTGLTTEELEQVSFFQATPSFHLKRKAQLDQVWGAVNALIETGSLRGVALQPPKYKATLPVVDPAGLLRLRDLLAPFARASEAFVPPVPSPATKPVGAGGGSHTKYVVTTAAGTSPQLPRNRAVLFLAHAAVQAGVPPTQVQQVLSPANVKGVPGHLTGDALWEALADTKPAGQQSAWFVHEPISSDGHTWVVRSNVWTAAAEAKMTGLCELTSGAVSYQVL